MLLRTVRSAQNMTRISALFSLFSSIFLISMDDLTRSHTLVTVSQSPASAADLAARLSALTGDIDPSSKKGRRRRAIIEAATQRFATLGYRKTSMEEIATAIGVAKGTLYLYFPTKIDLLVACAALEKLALLPRQDAILQSSEPATTRLREWIVFVLMAATESPLMSRLMDGDQEMAEMLADMPRAMVAESEANFYAWLGPLVKEIASEGHRWNELEIRDRCNAIRVLLHVAPTLRHDWARPGMSAKRCAYILADFVVGGLRAPHVTKDER